MRNTLLLTASEDRFIFENGIVAVLGDENQLVNSGIRKINRPLSFERGDMNQKRGNCWVRSSERLSVPGILFWERVPRLTETVGVSQPSVLHLITSEDETNWRSMSHGELIVVLHI